MSRDYKQWSGKIRDARFLEYKAARADGRIPAPGPCEICGQTKRTMHHAEEYGPEFADYLAALHSLCGRCHAWLHLRFRFPGLWSAYKLRCRTEGAQPLIRHMGEIFYAAGKGGDVPVVEYQHGGEWWELLTSDRYHPNDKLF
jgi:hypothetical protein